MLYLSNRYALPAGNIRGIGLVPFGFRVAADISRSLSAPLRGLSAAAEVHSGPLFSGLRVSVLGNDDCEVALEWAAVLMAADADLIPIDTLLRPTKKRARTTVEANTVVVVLPNATSATKVCCNNNNNCSP